MINNTDNKLSKEDLQGCLDCSLRLKEIATRLKCNGITVTRYLKKFGLKNEFKKKLNVDVDELYKLRVESHWNYEDLAELYKGSQAGIRKICEHFKFPKIEVTRLQDGIIEKIEVKKINKKCKDDKLSILLQELYDSF